MAAVTFWRLIALVAAALVVSLAAIAPSARPNRRILAERAVAAAALIIGIYVLLVAAKAVL